MRVEELKHLVLLQRPTSALNALNEATGGWENVITAGSGKLWAAIYDMTGRQFIAAGATQNAVVTRITIRKRDGVEAKMRVMHGAKIYEIDAVLDRQDHFMDLMCGRGVSNG